MITGIRALTFWGSYSTLISVTSPMVTPRKSTGAPTCRPFTEPGK